MIDIKEELTPAPKETQYFNFGQNIKITNFSDTIKFCADLIYNDKLKSMSGTVATNVPNQYKAKFIFKAYSNAGKLVLQDKIEPVVINYLKKFQYPDFTNPQTKNKCLDAKVFVAPNRLILQLLYYLNIQYSTEAYLTYDEVFNFVYLRAVREDLSNPNIPKIINDILEGRKKKTIYNAHAELYNNYWNKPWRQYHEEIVGLLKYSSLVEVTENYTLYLKRKLSKKQQKYLCEIIFYNDFIKDDISLDDYYDYLDLSENDTERILGEPMIQKKEFKELNYITDSKKVGIYNRIVFGAPGTGKSYTLKHNSENNFKTVERVTFHPNYSYGQFVGTYKPVSEEGDITYRFVPGPFMRVIVSALENGKNNNASNYLLIIEEINRANVAAVFGDMFQLLDRTKDGESEYEIQTSEDVRKYLAEELGGTPNDYLTLKIPNNMYIWATMNSADQGVFPMDTAFKRRWNFEYIGIDAVDDKLKDKYYIPISNDKKVKWNDFRTAINDRLISMKINEDKLLGFFFLSNSVLSSATEMIENKDSVSIENFISLFKSKVIMYLFEDVLKMHHDFFNVKNNRLIYSEVCNEFNNGLDVFGINIPIYKISDGSLIKGLDDKENE